MQFQKGIFYYKFDIQILLYHGLKQVDLCTKGLWEDVFGNKESILLFVPIHDPHVSFNPRWKWADGPFPNAEQLLIENKHNSEIILIRMFGMGWIRS